MVTVDGSQGFNVTSLAITMDNGVTFDFPDRRLDHAFAVINGQGDLVGLRAHDVIPGDASIVIHGLSAHFVDDHTHRDNTFETIADPAPNPSEFRHFKYPVTHDMDDDADRLGGSRLRRLSRDEERFESDH